MADNGVQDPHNLLSRARDERVGVERAPAQASSSALMHAGSGHMDRENGSRNRNGDNCSTSSGSENGSIPRSGVIEATSDKDLPEALLVLGWRKLWSRREERPYFFNKFSKESTWEVQCGDPLALKGVTEVEDSPKPSTADVRLSRPSTEIPVHVPSARNPHPAVSTPHPAVSNPHLARATPTTAGTPAHASAGPVGVSRKRRLSSVDGQPESGSMKKDDARFWNFDVPTNVYVELRAPSLLHCPHPDVELLRFHLMRDARQNFAHSLQHREGIEVPQNAYNRALLAHKICDRGSDPMLPTDCDPELCAALVREIMNDVPMKLVKPAHTGDARRLLTKFSEVCRKMADKLEFPVKEDRRKIKWHCEEVFLWLRKQNRHSFDDIMKRLSFLNKKCQPILAEAVQPSVENLCLKWYRAGKYIAEKVAARSNGILREQGIEVPAMPEVPDRTVESYPVHLITPSPGLEVVQFRPENESAHLIYRGDAVKVTLFHFHKLEQLYKRHCHDDLQLNLFLSRTWCLLKRYETANGTSTEGFGMQGALSTSVFECLHQRFGVTFECFASPLNCYFKNYCSAFADTDSFYGSCGPILDFFPKSGSLEANPPFCEELYEAMLDHFERLLVEATDALSICVIMPEHRDPPIEALTRLENSRFNRGQVVLPAFEHQYRHGMQHTCHPMEASVDVVHGTLVVFLQNEAGNRTWTPTPEKLKELVAAAKVK